MFYSLTFSRVDDNNWSTSSDVVNTWDTWKLIPTEKPVISLPAVKTEFTELKGVSGSIDNTESLIGVPIYGDRTGSITFDVLEPRHWNELVHDISSYFHNKRLKMFLEEEPEFYYIGRFQVSSTTQTDSYPQITFTYTLYPYKISKYTTTEMAKTDGTLWLWDDFNFEDGVCDDSDYKITFNKDSDAALSGNGSTSASGLIKTWTGEYPIRPSNEDYNEYWSSLRHRYKINPNLSEGIVTPTIKLTLNDGVLSTAFRFVNEELDIDTTGTMYPGSHMYMLIQFSNLSRKNTIKFYIRNSGTISFDMRRLML